MYRRAYSWWYGGTLVTLSEFKETEEEGVP